MNAIRATAEPRAETIPAGTHFWRAQLGATTVDVPIGGSDDFSVEDYPFDEDRMKPRQGRAREGRANPKGIPFLYLASHRDTACAEVRPWKSSVVSVGQFKATRDLRLVNTTLASKPALYLGRQPSAEKREEAVWGYIDHAFSEPTSLTDDETEYVPTQVLAECFRDEGYDGILYGSAYGPGHNIVLFDIAPADQVNCFVVRVREMIFDFELKEQCSYAVKLGPT